MDRCTAYAYWPHMEAACGKPINPPDARVTGRYGGYTEDSAGKLAPRCHEHLWCLRERERDMDEFLDELLDCIFDYQAGRVSFHELYTLALDLSPEMLDDERGRWLAGSIIAAEVEAGDRSGTVLAEYLQETTERVLRELGTHDLAIGELPPPPPMSSGSTVTSRVSTAPETD